MPGVEILTGVSQVSIAEDDATAVPALTGVPMTVTSIVPTDKLINSRQGPLLTGDTYNVSVALVGRDELNKGYTIAASTAFSANISPATVNDVLLVKIDQADFPVGMDKAVGAMIFLRINGADPQPVGFQLIDPDLDFVHVVHSKPLRRAPRFLPGTITAATPHRLLGNRLPKGVTYLPLTPTSGGVRLVHRVERIPYRPDDAPNADVPVVTATNLEFAVLSGDNLFLVQALSGNFVSFTDGGINYELSETDQQAAIARFNGNRSIIVDRPETTSGKFTRMLMLGNVTTNFSDVTEATTKTDQFQLDFRLEHVALDFLTRTMHATVWKSSFI